MRPDKKPVNFQAFPVSAPDGYLEKGMTFREYAAVTLLAGMLASEVEGSTYSPEGAADRAVRMTDALMERLNA